MKKLNNYVLSAVILLAIGACSPSDKKKETSTPATETTSPTPKKEISGEDKIKLDQYMVEGKKLYKTYCIACHQENGEGLAKLYPPLAGSDYLLEDLPRAACGVIKGQTEPITVNGVQYNQIMPGFSNLTALEVAEIITYVSNSWSNEAGLSNVTEVEQWLQNCK